MERIFFTKQSLLTKGLTLAIIAILVSSCGQSNNVVSNRLIQKRKHNKGWFVKWNGIDSDKQKLDKQSQNRRTRDWDALIVTETVQKVQEKKMAVPSDSVVNLNSSESDQRTEERLETEREAQMANSTKKEPYVKEQIVSLGKKNIKEFPVFSTFPGFRAYDDVLDPILVIASFGIVVTLILLMVFVSLEEVVLFTMVIFAMSLIVLFIASFIRLLIGLSNYGINSPLEIAALIVGGIGFIAILTTILVAIFL